VTITAVLLALTPLTVTGALLACFGLGILAGIWVMRRSRVECDALPEPEEPRTIVVPDDMQFLDRQYLFMGKVAHALRNPLTGVLMSAELLQEEDDPTQIRQALERILEQGRQIQEVIMRIQEATALEACQYRLDLEAVQLKDAIEETVSQFRPRAKAKRQILEVDEPPPSVRVVADRRFLSSMLGELISNAIKYSPKDSTIRISTAPSDHGYAIQVADHGPGIAAEEQVQLFQRFVRLSPVPTAGESHIGLGLWSARVMTETLGGDLRVESAPGQGSRFVLDLLQAYAPPSTSTTTA